MIYTPNFATKGSATTQLFLHGNCAYYILQSQRAPIILKLATPGMICQSLLCIVLLGLNSDLSRYSATSIIRTPLSKAPVLGVRISEIVRITEVLTFLSFFDVPWYKTALVLQRKLQKESKEHLGLSYLAFSSLQTCLARSFNDRHAY